MSKMTPYIGTKRIKAKRMTRGAYNALRGWAVPVDENPDDTGFLVEYVDGGKSNHPDFAGYISWSPKDVFEQSYRAIAGQTFGEAIEALKAGCRVARAGWNGKDMWLALVPSWGYRVDAVEVKKHVLGCAQAPWIGMKTADSKFVPWLASQTDVLADDWEIVA